MNNTSIYLSDLCEPDTARHDLCTNGGCECPCHKMAALIRVIRSWDDDLDEITLVRPKSITRDAWETAASFPLILRPLVFVGVWPVAALWHWLDRRDARRAGPEEAG